ncbi:NAD(+) diphosphatase [Rosenbergiella australiborealis]|uniref:NAD-capped RNA hydrolase NudC n=1 Tax=Rosenbergiella australiborealis TaxID=1544696 RepID=A0ABS5TBV5_9GAMM|nr:NAD(+) diphosphatase [Rosenbergiella australiborealis]
MEHEGWWVVSNGRKLWLPDGELPYGTASGLGLEGKHARQIGEYQGKPCWLLCHEPSMNMESVRRLLATDRLLFQLAGRGVQLAEFYRSHRWCGYCGTQMHHSDKEFACLCEGCGERYYPQIAPCIIVAIRKGDSILLAQHHRHKQPIFTVLAGFVEAGETLEECVHREVMEESGLSIKNLHYVASQPWPFPHSLMCAFTAEYAGGEIIIDPAELKNAAWFNVSQLPKIPEIGTIARRLIEDTVALCRQD